MMNAEAQKEHRWLHRLVGEWTYESEAVMEAGKPPEKCGGIESVRSLGGLWILAEGQGEIPGQEGNHHPTSVPMGTFKSSDGLVNIAANRQYMWVAFCEALGAECSSRSANAADKSVCPAARLPASVNSGSWR